MVIVIAIVIVEQRATIAASDWADINKAQRAAAEGRTGCERTRVQ